MPELAHTPDGQTLIYPWITPAERLVVLNEMAWDGSHSPVVRAVVARALATLPRNPTDRLVFQRLLDAVFETVVYRPDPASDQDFYSPVALTLRPVPGNPLSPLTGQPKGVGDCEDTSVLFAAFVWAAGAMLGRPYRGVVEWLPQPGKPQNHVPAMACPTLGVRTFHGAESQVALLSEGCLWAETTLPGARIGEHPYEALARLGNAPRIEGATYPTNSSGALHALPIVLLAADGVRLFLAQPPQRGTQPAVAVPPSGAPFPVNVTL